MTRMTAFTGKEKANGGRSKYRKYKGEKHRMEVLVEQLQKKLKKYHDENKVIPDI